MQYHKFNLLFPVADEKTLNDLADDIATNGLIESIVIYEGLILDGKNRYLACMKAGVKPRYKEYKGDEPIQYVFTKNFYRRHLNATQRAILARVVYEKTIGTVKKKTLDEVAKIMNVSKTQVQKTKYWNWSSDTVKKAAQDGVISLHYVKAIVERAAAITGINPSTKDTTERKRLHDVQDKIMKEER